MKYINELREGNRMSGVYLCKHKQSAVTKNGKQYENVILQDRTGTIDAKIWDPNSMGMTTSTSAAISPYSTARFRFRSSVQERQERASTTRQTICRPAVTTSTRCIRNCFPGLER